MSSPKKNNLTTSQAQSRTVAKTRSVNDLRTSTKFADSRSMSWEYSPPMTLKPSNEIGYVLSGMPATNQSESKSGMTHSGPSNVMDGNSKVINTSKSNMISRDTSASNQIHSPVPQYPKQIANDPKARLTRDDSRAAESSSCIPKSPSPDLKPVLCEYPSASPTLHQSSPDLIASTSSSKTSHTKSPQLDHSTNRPCQNAKLSKSASLTSLHRPGLWLHNRLSSSVKSADGDMMHASRPQSASSQSLNLPREGLDSPPLHNLLGSHGDTQGEDGGCRKRKKRGIPTGTLQAISNMIVAKSGVIPKRSMSAHSLASTATKSASPAPVTSRPNDSNVADVRATLGTPHGSSTKRLQSPGLQSPQTRSKEFKTIAGQGGRSDGSPNDVIPLTKANLTSSQPRKPAALTRNNVMTSQVDSVMLVSLAGSNVMTSPSASVLCLAGAKEYIMDKYFEEIAKSWDQQDTTSTARGEEPAKVKRGKYESAAAFAFREARYRADLQVWALSQGEGDTSSGESEEEEGQHGAGNHALNGAYVAPPPADEQVLQPPQAQPPPQQQQQEQQQQPPPQQQQEQQQQPPPQQQQQEQQQQPPPQQQQEQQQQPPPQQQQQEQQQQPPPQLLQEAAEEEEEDDDDQQEAGSNDGPPDVTACGREYSTTSHQVAATVAARPMLCVCGAERSESGAQADDSVSLHDHRTPCVHAKRGVHSSHSPSNLRMYTQVNDLIHLEEPLTEEAVIKTLQARFYSKHYYTHIGQLLVLVNPLTLTPDPNPLSLHPTRSSGAHPLQRILQEAMRQQLDTGLSQTILLNGTSGSGKTHASSQLVRELFDAAGGGAETDSFKHLQAALTVLRALGSAATGQNPHSSRMGYFIENNLSDGAIYRTKIHCYFIDQSRVVSPLTNEKNFHIFYQMLAGLSVDDRAKYRLTGHSSHTLAYLSSSDVTQDDVRDREHFLTWKNALSVLGIPFADIMRVLSAILLIGNLEFVEGPGLELEVVGDVELQAVASLLGVAPASLYRGLSTRTRRARGQVFKALSDPQSANQARDALAKALYCRLVAAIIKRANNAKRLVVNCANSTDSNDSGQNDGFNQEGLLSRSSTTRGSGFGPSPPHAESFIGVLDMFGFEKLETNQLEQLSINLCAETLQHFYNTHTFRAAEEACADEAITADVDVAYVDNAPTIELLSSPRVGLLSLLDAESALQRGCPQTLLQKLHIQHSRNPRFFEPSNQNGCSFGIRHFCGSVTYDAHDLLTANRNQLPDDIIATFTKQNCSFGFASHLFSQEIKAIQEDGGGPKGSVYRISPSPIPERNSDLKGSLSSDFHLKLDGILQLLVSSRPHFIRCIKSNDNHQRELFEREVVKEQLRSLQLLETLHLMAAGFPHRLRYRAFNSRYQILLHGDTNRADKQYEESKLILDQLLKMLDETKTPSSNAHWALGKKHIFLSEGCRQLLEELRSRKRHLAATVIQSNWRRRMCQQKWPTLKRQLLLRKRERQPIRKHIRRNSLLEGVALKQHQMDITQQRPSSHYGSENIYMNGIGLQQYGAAPGTPGGMNRNHSGSDGSLYGQTPQFSNSLPTAARTAAQAAREQGASTQGQQTNLHPHHSQGSAGAQRPGTAVNGHRRQGSYDLHNTNRDTYQASGSVRYSFHGDTRPSRPSAGDSCNQRPRSKSSERHYISHAEYQRHQQFQARQRHSSYSSYTDLHASGSQGQRLSHNNQPPSVPGQVSQASSTTGSLIGGPTKGNSQGNMTRDMGYSGNNVYSSHNGVSNPQRSLQNQPPDLQRPTAHSSQVIRGDGRQVGSSSQKYNGGRAETDTKLVNGHSGHGHSLGPNVHGQHSPGLNSYGHGSNNRGHGPTSHGRGPISHSHGPNGQSGRSNGTGHGVNTLGQGPNSYSHGPSLHSPGSNGGPSSRQSQPSSSEQQLSFQPPKEHPPPVPASRTYTVKGNMKLGYPQVRVMRETYQDNLNTHKILRGQEIKVVGASSKRGFFLVEFGKDIIHVPHHLTELKAVPLTRQGIDV